MKTTNEIKDEVAKSHGLKDWEEVIGRSFSTLRVHLENEAMEAYAQQFREGEKVFPCNHSFVNQDSRWKKCEFCGDIRPYQWP